MNVPRNYKPRLFQILDIPPRMLSKNQLSKEIASWLTRNPGIYYNASITSNPIMYELSGIPIGNTYYTLGDGWWQLTTLIYSKWVIRDTIPRITRRSTLNTTQPTIDTTTTTTTTTTTEPTIDTTNQTTRRSKRLLAKSTL
jgi:hypothetical protein